MLMHLGMQRHLRIGRATRTEDIISIRIQASPVRRSRIVDKLVQRYLFTKIHIFLTISFLINVESGPPVLIHRSNLLKALQSALPSFNSPLCTIHTSHRLVSYTRTPSAPHSMPLQEHEQPDIPASGPGHESGPITLHFSDGTTATADVLIGADGIRSTVRKVMFQHIIEDGEPIELSTSTGDDGDGDGFGVRGGKTEKRPMTEEDARECVEARWSGTVVYRSLVKKEKLVEAWRERGKESEHRLMRYPIIVSYTMSTSKIAI